jgi:invasion protein IalB
MQSMESRLKVITQQIKNWTLQCAEDHGKKLCEISEALQIPNSNYRFSISHSFYLNEKKEKKENITFIVPLGANLKKKLNFNF